MKIAYMTGEYLRISPFAFIYREVASVRAAGVPIETISVRGTPESACVSPEQRAERLNTRVLLPFSIVELAFAHGRLKWTSPLRYWRAIRLAWTTRAPGLSAMARQFAYFLEAGLVADHLHRRGLTHLHNHLGDSSCTVAMLAAEMGGFTFSFSLHGPGIFFEPERWRLDVKLKRALFVRCISQFCRGQAMIWTPPERWDRLHIVHCGLDPGAFDVKRHGGPGRRLIFVGRLTAVKGLPLLLEAVARLKDRLAGLTLTLAGDGPDRAWLESRARELGVAEQVEITGYLSPDEVRERLSGADVFVMASFAEGVPVVLMEAMASGLPVVATQVAGVGELVEDGRSGFLVPPGDVESLVSRVEMLLADPALRNRMGAAGRGRVEAEFNSGAESRKLLGLFERYLGEAGTMP